MPVTKSIYCCNYVDWLPSVSKLLNESHLIDSLPPGKPVLLKPNLVEAMKPPITTPVGLIEAIIHYLQTHTPETEILIGEGCGSLNYDTFHSYQELGYNAMAQQTKTTLVDLHNGIQNVDPGYFVDLAKNTVKKVGEDLGLNENDVDLVFDTSGVCFTLSE